MRRYILNPNGDCSATGTGSEMWMRYRKGDDTALESIVILYSDNLMFYINGYVKNISVAEDILAEVFLKLVIHAKRFREESSIKTYLYRIATNASIDYIRKQSRRSSVVLDECYELYDEAQELEKIVMNNEQKRELHKAMRQLKAEYRNALFLVYFEGLSYVEAAKILGCSMKQVNNSIYRAKQSLRSIYQREGFSFE